MSRWTDERERRRTQPRPFHLEAAREALAGFFFAGFPEARAAFLFGSRARGDVRPSSDLERIEKGEFGVGYRTRRAVADKAG